MGNNEINRWIVEILLWFGLIGNGIMDVIKKKISTVLVTFMFITGIAVHIVEGSVLEVQTLYSFIPGIVCMIISFLSQGEIGMGDAWMLLAMGALMKYEILFSTCVMGMLFAAVAAVVLFVVFHKNRKYTIPFIPFLAMGYLCVRYML